MLRRRQLFVLLVVLCLIVFPGTCIGKRSKTVDGGTVTSKIERAESLLETSKYSEAIRVAKGILKEETENVDAMFILASAAQKQRDNTAVAEWAGKIANLVSPNSSEYGRAKMMHASSAQKSGDGFQAVRLLESVPQDNPRFADAMKQLGSLQEKSGNYDGAESAYTRALEADPYHYDSLMNLGVLYDRQSLPVEALKLFLRAAERYPDRADALGNCAAAFDRLGYAAESLHYSLLALQNDPTDYRFLIGAGVGYQKVGDLESCERMFALALEQRPDESEAHFNHAVVLEQLGRLPEAAQEQASAAMYRFGLPDAPLGLGTCLMRRGDDLCYWGDYNKRLLYLKEIVKGDLAAQQHLGGQAPFLSVFHTLTLGIPMDLQWQVDEKWGIYVYSRQAHVRRRLNFNHDRKRSLYRGNPPKTLRIGYLSHDFNEHPTCYLLRDLFKTHDRTRVHVIAYSYGSKDMSVKDGIGFYSPCRDAVKNGVDEFIDIDSLNMAESAQRIFDDHVDILVDLTGYLKGSRADVLALRPAPVNAHLLVFPGSMGSNIIDYFIADRVSAPPEYGSNQFHEALYYMPHTYQINSRDPPGGAPPTRAEHGLPEDAVIVSCFNSLYKTDPFIFRVWTNVLVRSPQTVLWLPVSNPEAVKNLKAEALAAGIPEHRLIFVRKVDQREHLKRLQLADIAMDTLMVNGHTTTSDALWAGVPVVTIAGDKFVTRVAASLSVAVGLPQMVVSGYADYEDLVVELCNNPPALRALQEELRSNRGVMPLFDTESYTRELEDGFFSMVGEWAAGNVGL